MESGIPFSGVRFALLGFNPIDGNTLRSKLLNGGGVEVGHYSQTCTHLIVDTLVYDDPICVAARSNGQVVVTGSWVDHSFDIGMLIDSDSVLYRPVKDLNGIPGAQSLVVCLTGYQPQDREDIMTMVGLMGGEFSKPLVANQVTHLICYKFEGEKYELAKAIKRIKIVNHRWLEDCLKNWKLLPEIEYAISGYDLEMMGASARDSEDEAEDASVKRASNSPLGVRVSGVAAVEMSKSRVVQTTSGAGEGSSLCNTSRENPKNMDRNREAMVSSDAVSVQQYNNHRRASIYQESEPGSLKENLPRTNDPTVSGEIGHKSPASAKLLSSNVVPMEVAISTAENSILKCARDGVSEISSSEPVVGNLVRLPEPISGSPKQNLKVAPHPNDGTAHKVDLSDSATRLFNLGVVPMEADIWTRKNVNFKGALDMVPERSVTEPVTRRFGSPRSGLIGMKDQQETVLPKKKTVARKNLGSRGKKKSPINQKGSLYLSEPTPNKGKASAPVTDNGNQKEISSSVLNTVAVPEMANYIDPKTDDALDSGFSYFNRRSTDSADNKSFEKDQPVLDQIVNQDKLQGKTSEEADAEVGITMLEAELNDIPSESLFQLEADKKKSKLNREATVAKNSLQIGKRESSSTAKVGKFRTKKSGEEEDAKTNDTVMKDVRDKSVEERENFALENQSGKVSSGGDYSPVAGETLARIEAVTRDPSDAAVQLEVDKNTGRRRKENTVEKDSLQNGSSSTAEFEKRSVKKAKSSIIEDDANAADTVMENIAMDNEFGDISSQGTQSPVAGKSLARKEATVERSSVQSGEKRTSSTVEVGKSSVKKTKKSRKERGAKATSTVMKHIGDNSAEEMENIAVDDEFDGTQSPVTGKPLARKEAAMEIEVGKNECKLGKEAIVERSSVQNGKKGSSSTVEVGKSSVKKTKKSKKEKKNIAGEIGSSGKPLASTKAKTCTKVSKESEQLTSKPMGSRKVVEEPKFFTVSGPKDQRKEYQQIIKSLKGKCCRDSHQWSYQATHFIAPEMRRTEKFFAAAASGSWILKTDYVADSKEAGKLLPEEPYEWHSSGLSTDGVINLEAPRKWRLVREQTGHGALYGMRIVVYGDCNFPPLDTLKRAVKAGDGTILATAPPYTRFLNQKTDFAVISFEIPRTDSWIQEFMRHEIPCVLADYLVEYVCKSGYPLDKYVLYGTHSWAERSFNKLQVSAEEKVVAEEEEEAVDSPNIDDVACEVCGSREREEVMLICGDEEGLSGCGIGTHIDCCDPPLTHVPEHDWFCSRCNVKSPNKKKKGNF